MEQFENASNCLEETGYLGLRGLFQLVERSFDLLQMSPVMAGHPIGVQMQRLLDRPSCANERISAFPIFGGQR